MVRLADILTEIDRIADAIEAQKQLMVNVDPCCSDQPEFTGDEIDEVWDDIGDVPQNIIDAGYASGVTDWTGWREYKCMIAHLFLNGVIQKINQLSSWAGVGALDSAGFGAAAGLLKILALSPVLSTFISVPLLGPLAAVAGLFAAVFGLTAVQLQAWAEDLEENRADLTCAIYGGDGTAGSLAAFFDAVDALNATFGLVVRNLNLYPAFAALYGGRNDTQNVAQLLADGNYDVADYECCVEPLGPAVGMIVSQSGCTSHSVGDVVHENEDITFTSLQSGAVYYAKLILMNTTGNGPVGDNNFEMTAINGFTDYPSPQINRYSWYTNPNYPYIGARQSTHFTFNQAVPYMWHNHYHRAGHQLFGSTAFTCTVRVYNYTP